MGDQGLGDVGAVELGPDLQGGDHSDPGHLGAGGVLAGLGVLCGLQREPLGPLAVLTQTTGLDVRSIGVIRPGHPDHGGRLIGKLSDLRVTVSAQRDLRERDVDDAGLTVLHRGVGESGRGAEDSSPGGNGGGGDEQSATRERGAAGGVGGGGNVPRGHV